MLSITQKKKKVKYLLSEEKERCFLSDDERVYLRRSNCMREVSV